MMKTVFLVVLAISQAISLPVYDPYVEWMEQKVEQYDHMLTQFKETSVKEGFNKKVSQDVDHFTNLVTLAKDLGCSQFVKYLDEVPHLKKLLQNDGPFTIILPTDEAFAALSPHGKVEVRDHLAQNLLGHIARGLVYSSELYNERLVPTLLFFDDKEVDLRFNIYLDGKVVTASGSILIKTDQNATNGVIHVTDRVILPMPLYDIVVEMAEIRNATGLMMSAVGLAGVAETLDGDGPFTVFAPKNEAFEKMRNPSLMDLMKNRTALKEVVLYHIVAGTIYEAGLRDGDRLTTLNGGQLRIEEEGPDKEGGDRVNFIEVAFPDVAATNGVIHLLAGVLIPPEIRAAYKKSSPDTIFEELLSPSLV
ncbi:transforming growth factor-beta-induced protein ig-h3-like [Lineus longissimus]|uniref:transforming growth factor-beta-induced protein ig-h3-like n=1 Tax=Lineus longissimus TaxID=88925 RepID=UPI002B4D212E